MTALLLAVLVPLSGCSAWFLPPTTNATSTPSEEKVAADLEPFYGQLLRWKSCGDGMQCSTLTTPLDWADPTGDTIKLALVRQQATSGKAIGSLLVNPGGPGGSGYDFVHDSVDYATSDALQKQYDIVGFDPRGVGRSTAVDCYDDPAEFDAINFDIPKGVRGSDAWLAEVTATAGKFGAACLDHTGDLLAHVDTVSVARDLDVLRAALGDAKLNYLGYSYGTLIGATYADLFPTKTGRLVLDGAVDPTATAFDISLEQAKGFESSLRAFLAKCPTLSGCPFSGTVDESMTEIRALLDSLDASPLKNSDGRQLGANTMFTAIVYPLYSPDNWPALVQVFTTVMAGDASSAFQVADAYYSRSSDGTYSTNSAEAFSAVNCLDYPLDDNVATMRAEAAQLDAEAPVFGHLMAWGGTSCAKWPFPPTGNVDPIAAKGSADILVVGTTDDPAAPYVWAKSLANQLENGHLVTFTGEGHTAYNKSNACINTTVDDYLLAGTVPATDPQC